MTIIEELREIAQRKCNCHEVVRMFGFACGESPCTECIPRLIGAISDRIDAERALPEGIEWPRFEDGELVRRGDEVEWDGDVMRVGAFWFHREGWSLNVFCPGLDGTFHGEYGERVKRPTPKLLDADGVPIEVGDTVYCDGEDEPLTVTYINGVGGGYCSVTVKNTDLTYCTVDAPRLSHERPDSWEQMERDAKLAPRDYLESRGMNPEKPERIASMMADIVSRAKALAKAGEQG